MISAVEPTYADRHCFFDEDDSNPSDEEAFKAKRPYQDYDAFDEMAAQAKAEEEEQAQDRRLTEEEPVIYELGKEEEQADHAAYFQLDSCIRDSGEQPEEDQFSRFRRDFGLTTTSDDNPRGIIDDSDEGYERLRAQIRTAVDSCNEVELSALIDKARSVGQAIPWMEELDAAEAALYEMTCE